MPPKILKTPALYFCRNLKDLRGGLNLGEGEEDLLLGEENHDFCEKTTKLSHEIVLIFGSAHFFLNFKMSSSISSLNFPMCCII